MAMEIDDAMKQEKEYKMLLDKREVKKNIKNKALIELQRQKKMDVSDDEMIANEDLMVKPKVAAADGAADSSENDDDLDEERELQKIMKEQIHLKK